MAQLPVSIGAVQFDGALPLLRDCYRLVKVWADAYVLDGEGRVQDIDQSAVELAGLAALGLALRDLPVATWPTLRALRYDVIAYGEQVFEVLGNVYPVADVLRAASAAMAVVRESLPVPPVAEVEDTADFSEARLAAGC